MKERRFFYVPDAPFVSELPPDEATHAIRVLRMAPGDELFLMDGKGCFFLAVMEQVTNKRAFFQIVETMPQQRRWRGHVHLAIAPTKMAERMEWMVEKAVEVGVDEISFLNTAFSERKVVRNDRFQKIAVAAMKQSRKGWLAKVNEMVTFESFINKPRRGTCCIAHCYPEMARLDFFSLICGEQEDDNQDITILVGPEGDFSADEVERAVNNGYKGVSLGSSRLRTETAGLAAVMMAHLARRI